MYSIITYKDGSVHTVARDMSYLEAKTLLVILELSSIITGRVYTLIYVEL